MMRVALVDKQRKMQGLPVDKSQFLQCLVYRSLILQGSIVLAAAALAGCASVPHVEVQTVKVPVPVECREPIPDRPAMPTEALPDDAGPFELLRAALAEIDRREGYEIQLRTALDNCKRPFKVPEK